MSWLKEDPPHDPLYTSHQVSRRLLLSAASLSLAPATVHAEQWKLIKSKTETKPEPVLPRAFISNSRQEAPVFLPEAILLNTVPKDCPPLKAIQKELDRFNVLRDSNGQLITASEPAFWPVLLEAQVEAQTGLSQSQSLLRLFVKASQMREAEEAADQLLKEMDLLGEAVKKKDVALVLSRQKSCMRMLLTIANYAAGKFPYSPPRGGPFETLPRLLGRATVDIYVRLQESQRVAKMVCMVDGFNAPITAGNFIDLVQRGFFNGLPLAPALENNALSGGLLGDSVQGFWDPRTGNLRTIPLEVMESEGIFPEYGKPLPNNSTPMLPFALKGALGLGQSGTDVNSASSEFFLLRGLPTPSWCLEDSQVTSQLNGRYAAFGYILEGGEIIDELRPGDVMQDMVVTSGADLLAKPSANPTYSKRSVGSTRDYGVISGEYVEDDYSAISGSVPGAADQTIKQGTLDLSAAPLIIDPNGAYGEIDEYAVPTQTK